MRLDITRTGDLVSAPPGAAWPALCVRCGREGEPTAVEVRWSDARREALMLLPLAAAILGQEWGLCAGASAALGAALLMQQRRTLPARLCARHAADRRREGTIRQILQITAAAAVLLAVSAILWLLFQRHPAQLQQHLGWLIVVLASGGSLLILTGYRTSALAVRSAGPDRLLLEAHPRLTAALPVDPQDTAPILDLPPTLPIPSMPDPSPPDLSPPDLRNPFAPLPVARPPLSAAIWRDGLEVIAPEGAAWPDRCVRCACPAEGRRLPLYLLPLPGPLAALSAVAGRFAPGLEPFGFAGICGTHLWLHRLSRLLIALPVALAVGVPLGLVSTRSAFMAGPTALFSLLIGLYLRLDVRVRRYDPPEGARPAVARLRLPAPFLSALPAPPERPPA